MTEAEWLACEDSTALLDSLPTGVSDRQFRLFACACVRRVWHLLADERSQRAVETAERYADGLADRQQLIAAKDEAREAKRQSRWPKCPDTIYRAASAAQDATRDSGRSAAHNCVWEASRAKCERDTNRCDESELIHQAILLRDIVSNPFRPVAIDPSSRSLSVVGLAQTIYDDRAFNRMPDLGEALNRVGCREELILDHCRQTDSHVLGCWVIDLILGKERAS